MTTALCLAVAACLQAANAQPPTCYAFDNGKTAGWAASSPRTVNVTVRKGPTGGALAAETAQDRLYVGRSWQFVETDSCLSFDFCSAGPAAPYYVQLAVKTAAGKGRWCMPANRPTMGEWTHVDVPLTRTFPQSLVGQRIVWVWIGQVRAQGAAGQKHSLLIDNVRLRHNVPQVKDRDMFVSATRLAEPPVIDGQLEDRAWLDVSPLGIALQFDGKVTTRRADLRIGYDDQRLYLALDSRDDPAKLAAKETKPDGPVWQDDSFEVFLDPNRDRSTYYQLATNPLGTPYTQRGTLEPNGTMRVDTSWNPNWQVKAQRRGQGWTAEMCIPFAEIGGRPAGAWGFQVGRHRPKGQTCSLFLREKDWCNPQEWGLLVFGDKPAGLRLEALDRTTLRGLVGGTRPLWVRTDALGRSGESLRTEKETRPGMFAVDYQVMPAGKQRLAVTALQARGEERVPACRFILPLLHTRDGHVFRPQILAESDALRLWTLGPTQKILPSDQVVGSSPRPLLQLQAARGQTKALQLAVTPRRVPLRGLRLEFSDLTSAQARIERSALRYDIVDYVTIKEPSDFTTFPGPWPDPLLPPAPVHAEAEAHVVFWVTLSAPRDAESGMYAGDARLLGDGVDLRYRVQLQVLNFELPRQSHLTVEADVWYGWGVYAKLYGGIPYEDFLKNAAEHRISGIGRIRGREREDMIRAGRQYYGQGLRFSWFPVPFIGAGDWKGRRKWFGLDIDPDDPAFASAFVGRIRSVADVFREQGWIDKTALWIWDEPFWKQDAALRDKLPKLCKLVRQAARDLPIFLSHPPESELEGLVDIWCPALHFGAPDLSPRSVADRHRKGQQIWVYHNELALIDHPGIHARILPWIARKIRADGVIWWSINFWGGTGGVKHLDPWTEGKGKKRYRHGDGWFLYPTKARTGILNSIRWELFREGLNDYDTLHLLEQRLAEAKKSAGPRSDWLRRADKALADADAMVKSYREFVADAERLESIVRRAEALLHESTALAKRR